MDLTKSSSNENTSSRTSSTSSKKMSTSTSVPLEQLFIELKNSQDGGEIIKKRALSKDHVPKWKFIRFYMPKLSGIENDGSILESWKELMSMYRDDLKWLLISPHHVFWSVMLYSENLVDQSLPSFLTKAPRHYHPDFEAYENHKVISPLYTEIYNLIFRVYLRVSTYKESKDEYISRETWVKWLQEYNLISISKLMDLTALYSQKENKMMRKMTENILKYLIPSDLDAAISLMMHKFLDLDFDLEDKLRGNKNCDWNFEYFQKILLLRIDLFYSLYKFLKVCPQTTKHFHNSPDFEINFAASYDKNVRLWDKVIQRIPKLRHLNSQLRTCMLLSFRNILITPTIHDLESYNESKLDEYFTSMTNVLQEKYLIRDLEITFPFKRDIEKILSSGAYIDEIRINFLAAAITDCFKECGEDYKIEKIVADPLYDPTFDRQQLGACSLDLTGVELKSLISQVQDLLPELPEPYIEVCLKHYEYSAETVINCILENTVPSRFEKYKAENYCKTSREDLSSTSSSSSAHLKTNSNSSINNKKNKNANLNLSILKNINN